MGKYSISCRSYNYNFDDPKSTSFKLLPRFPNNTFNYELVPPTNYPNQSFELLIDETIRLQNYELCLTLINSKPTLSNCSISQNSWLFLSQTHQIIESNSLLCLTSHNDTVISLPCSKTKIVNQQWYFELETPNTTITELFQSTRDLSELIEFGQEHKQQGTEINDPHMNKTYFWGKLMNMQTNPKLCVIF